MSELALPERWVETKLSNIYIKIVGGGTPSKANPSYFVGDIPWMSVKDMKGYAPKNTQDHITQEAIENSATNLIPKGVPILATRMSLGKVVVVNFDTAINQDLKAIFLPEHVINPYFVYWYRSKTNLINSLGTGTTVKGIRLDDLKNLSFILCCLNEQKEIVKFLDTHLTTVSQIQARLDAIPKLIEKFRQSVLNDAFCGKLTEEWRKNNNEEGNAFIDQIEIDRFRTQKLIELPKNWQWLKFDTVADIASNLQDPKLMPKAIHLAPNHIAGHKGKVIEISTIEADNVKSAKHGFTKGQIIYSKIRPYLCKVVIADFDGLCSADMYPINSKVETKYLLYWMLSAKFTYWASNAESRSVLPKINQKDLNQIPTPTAPIKEQKEIVRLIEILFAYADQIEKSVATAKARVDNLTQSILHQAFTGNLTAEWRKKNPELISGDNSAEALLAKIKAEKQGSSKKVKKA